MIQMPKIATTMAFLVGGSLLGTFGAGVAGAGTWESLQYPLHVYSDSGTLHGSAYGNFYKNGAAGRSYSRYKDDRADGKAIWLDQTVYQHVGSRRDEAVDINPPSTQSMTWIDQGTNFDLWTYCDSYDEAVVLTHQVDWAPDDRAGDDPRFNC